MCPHLDRHNAGRGMDIKPRALCVSIYPELTDSLRRFSAELDMPMDIIEGGIYSDGHLYAREIQDQYDVIISQAGTALCIQQLVHIPVLSSS
jgi:hypothetical protein